MLAFTEKKKSTLLMSGVKDELHVGSWLAISKTHNFTCAQ